jgi:hypothetical protein
MARRTKVVALAPFVDLGASGARGFGCDRLFKRGYAFPLDADRTSVGRAAAVVLLHSKAGGFGWRLTDRQAAALVRAGFTCRSLA